MYIHIEYSVYLHYSVRKLCRCMIVCDQEHLCFEMFIEHDRINYGFFTFFSDFQFTLEQMWSCLFSNFLTQSVNNTILVVMQEPKEDKFLTKKIHVLYASLNVFGSSCPFYSATLHSTHNDDVQEILIKYLFMDGHQKWQSVNTGIYSGIFPSAPGKIEKWTRWNEKPQGPVRYMNIQ